MQPLETIDQATTSDGKELTLLRRGADYYIKIDNQDLMSSRTHGSEEALAQQALARLGQVEAPQILVGGLGMGFTLRAVLDAASGTTSVLVAEVFDEVVRWNRETLGRLAGEPLRDPRVRVVVADVLTQLDPGAFDAIMLDVDNGPDALTRSDNAGLYDGTGLARLARALRPGGVLAVWSAAPDAGFLRRIGTTGLSASSEVVRARRGGKGARHTLFFGVSRAGPRA
jgi:spermidine synthase